MDQREHVLQGIANYAFINRPINGYYMEFGCCGANTIRLAWDHFHDRFPWHFVAFDSFEGFPDIQPIDAQEIWQKGKAKIALDAFKKCVEDHGVSSDRLTIVPGFYDQSLTKELQKKLLPVKAAVIYIDCDLYHSTIHVLEFIVPFLQQGTVIVFDEWNAYYGDPAKGERLAFSEFRQRYPQFLFEQFISTQMAQSFLCVSTFLNP